MMPDWDRWGQDRPHDDYNLQLFHLWETKLFFFFQMEGRKLLFTSTSMPMRHPWCFSALARMAFFFPVLMQARQRGVVPVRRHILRYHFTSGQYAREHSNVSRRACKVDVTLPAPATHLLKVPISSHTCLRMHMLE